MVLATVVSHRNGRHIVSLLFLSLHGDKTSVTNYRPIYLSIIHFIYDQISTHQFGFMRGRSTQQLLILLNDIHINTKAVIYLDFAKAFNWVPHNKLLLKLWKIGITAWRPHGSGLILISAIEVSVSVSTALILAFYQLYLVYLKEAS